jgi:uncharacterized protein YndB with AHSA1/START domain
MQTDWSVGSAMTWEQDGVTVADPAQVVLESEPHRRRSYSWHTFTPEFAEKFGLGDEVFTKAASERSRVTFTIEPVGQMVRLTVVHDGFEPDSAILEGISEGWPVILANLKTLLETGDTLPVPAMTAERK